MGDGIQFASVGPTRVGYETHGSGDLDIVYSPGLPTHLDLTMEQPRYRRMIEELTAYGRVIRFDRRGAGVSDPLPADAGEGWEIWADDLAAVLDDAGSARASILASNDAGAASILFAATQPERVHSLVLFNTTACFVAADGYPEGHPPEMAEFVVETLRSVWGTEAGADFLAPSIAADEPFRRWLARFQRGACSPAMMADGTARAMRTDARHVLAEVRCRTLVLGRRDYVTMPPAQGRYMARMIPGATFEEVDGGDAPIYTQGMEEIVERIGRFLGRTPAPRSEEGRFATVLFTDIVSSTERAVELGDRGWHALLGEHDAATRDAVAAQEGRVIKSTGDGVLATFEAPTRALRCAFQIRERVRSLGIDLRAGLHAGPVVEASDGDISGIAVNVAARVMGEAGTGEVLASSGVADLVSGDELSFEDRGERELKGLPGSYALFAVTAAP